jgi:hypothetical protein
VGSGWGITNVSAGIDVVTGGVGHGGLGQGGTIARISAIEWDAKLAFDVASVEARGKRKLKLKIGAKGRSSWLPATEVID